MQRINRISTPPHNGLFDITGEVEAIVPENGISSGIVKELYFTSILILQLMKVIGTMIENSRYQAGF